MKAGTAQKFSNALLSGAAGVASFVFSLCAFLYITNLNDQIIASIVAGAFCLLICYIASERPNSESARALTALGDRLLAVEDGDLVSPPPAIVRQNMPKLAAAVDTLFAEVRASIENAQALGMYDPVTSLPNRLHFRSEADKLLGGAVAWCSCAMLPARWASMAWRRPGRSSGWTRESQAALPSPRPSRHTPNRWRRGRTLRCR